MKRAALFFVYLAWFVAWVFIGTVIATCINPNKAYGATVLYEAWIYETDELNITIEWDAVEGATYYQAKIESLHLVQEWVQSVSETSAVFQRPRVGLFRFYVRGCRLLDGEVNCSEWTRSDGPRSIVTRADGQTISQAWLVLFRLAPPIIR